MAPVLSGRNKMKHDIATVVKTAGIRIDEFAHLCNVSRASASKGINKRSKPHSMVRTVVDKVITKLVVMCEQKELPLLPAEGTQRIITRTAKRGTDGKVLPQAAYARVKLLDLMKDM